MDLDSSMVSDTTAGASEEQYADDHEKQHFHVLAVDDSHIDRKLLEKLLTVSSYQVTCVDSGDKALEYLGLQDNIHEDDEYDRSPPPLSSTTISCSSSPSSKSVSQQEVSKVNLIMTDYSMPGISGYDLLKRIKDSSWKDIPVVVMSSENVPSRINMCLEGGAEEFLLKPVKLSDLRKLHNRHLQKPCPDNHPINNPITCNNNIIEIANIKQNDSETDKNCSNTNKRKANLATSSDISDRRPRVQELPVS